MPRATAGFALGAVLVMGAGPARADVLSEMTNFWRGAAVNTTGPTAFDGQASGHWTLGNLYLRAPVRSEQIATVNLPSFRAGCGGIDAFAGAFSFIDSDQLIAFGRAVAQNAAGFAFELALETISPVIAETMAKLRALAQWVNDRNLNSCETAQALVGAVWSKNDRASAAICAAIGTSQGIFSDYAAAKHGCGSEGKRNSTLASASGAMADQVPVNVNYAWKAVRASSFLSGDTQLAEFAMSVSGTVIVTAPTSPTGTTAGPRVRVLEPLALDRRVTEILMEGGGDLPVYRCDETAPLPQPHALGRVNVPADRGFRARVAGSAARSRRCRAHGYRRRRPRRSGWSTSPRFRSTGWRTRRRPIAGRGHRPGDGRAGRKPWRSTCSRSGSPICTAPSRSGPARSTSPMATSSGAGARGCRANRVALARHRNEGLERFNTALAVVEKLRLIETELAGALSRRILRAALAFSRGGAAAGSR